MSSAQKLSLVLLGTLAGPPVEEERAGTATALVVDDDVYLVDCGRAAVTQLVKAGLALGRIRAVFVTHLHADHIADLYNLFLLGGVPNLADDRIASRTPVHGPGSAGALPPPFPGLSPRTVSPDAPTPGLRDYFEHSHRAVAYSSNVLMRDSAIPDVTELMDVHEIELPDVGASALGETAPRMAPFPVMADEHVRVSATLVPHGPCFPSFAYRFDTVHGSVTFSGDTARSENLVELASGSDVLVHEAVNLQGGRMNEAMHDHMLTSHVEVQEVGEVAALAGVDHLVLSHLKDFSTPRIDRDAWGRHAQVGFDGRVTVGHDLQVITVA